MNNNIFLDVKRQPPEALSVACTSMVFEAQVTLFAVWTLLAQSFLVAGFSFKSLTVTFSVIMVLLSLYMLFFRTKTWRLKSTPDYSVMSMLIMLCIIGSSLALFAIRPDADDVNYISRAVFYLDNPSFNLDFFYRNHAFPEFDFYSPLFITQTCELFYAYISFVFKLRFLDIYYFVVPIFGGMLIPMAWFFVLSRLTKNNLTAVLGTAVIVAFLCIDGGTHRSFGNFAFVRVWQGKVILMAILMPLFAAFSINFFRDASARNWRNLFLLGVASTGFSKSAIFLMPSLALSLGAGYLAADVRDFAGLKKLLVYFTTLLYPVLIGLYCLSSARQTLSGSSVLNYGWPNSFSGAYKYVFGGYLTFSSILFYLSVGTCILFVKGPLRKFLFGWLVCVLIVFLNPLLSGIIAEYLTSANAYWRLFYILPFPLMLGMSVEPLFQGRLIKIRFAYLFVAVLAVFTILINYVPNSLAVFNKTEFGLLRYKIPKEVESDVKTMIVNLPDGPMLSPIKYSSVIPMFTSRLPQVAVRGFELEYFASINGRPEIARQRLAAVGFVSGTNYNGFVPFVYLLQHGLRTVVLEPNIADSPLVKKVLLENDFVPLMRAETYAVYATRKGLRVDYKNPTP